jgi:TonB family protein
MALRILLVLILATASLPAKTPSNRALQKACAFTFPKQHDLVPGGFKLEENEGYQHTPAFAFTIDSDGKVTDLRLVQNSRITRLDAAILSAIKNWKFKFRGQCPGIETQMSITIDWF